MTYPDARAYLNTFLNYERVPINAGLPRAFNLTRLQRLLEAMGNPHRSFPAVHLAGTKGKGSTAVFLERILREAGYQTGLYVQPHLLSPRERIVLRGRAIDPAVFADWVQRWLPLLERFRETEAGRLTYFEAYTALAFSYFAREGVELAVVETGLGGRLDATNLLEPILTVLTPIGFDHLHVLGATLRAIAAEKAGIIKTGVPVVMAEQPEPAEAVIRREAERREAPLIPVVEQVQEHRVGIREWREQVLLECRGRRYRLSLRMLGGHQAKNAATALVAAWTLRDRGWQISDRAIVAGLDRAWLAGRVDWSPRPDGGTVVLDGAHTPESARALRSVLEELWPAQRISFLVSMAKDKDPTSFSTLLAPIAAEAIFTRTRISPRAADPAVLQAVWEAQGITTHVVDDLPAAMATASQSILCLTGSIHFVGAAMKKKVAPYAVQRWVHEIGLGTENLL